MSVLYFVMTGGHNICLLRQRYYSRKGRHSFDLAKTLMFVQLDNVAVSFFWDASKNISYNLRADVNICLGAE